MTDNEIVKALKCCIETSGVNCGKCPYCDNCITDENTSLMMTDTLDLINRQKAEIEMDDVEIKELRIALQGYLDDLTKERNLYKKSIEELNQAKAEIERLKQIVGFTPARGSRKSPLLNAVLDNVRAEAVKEFAEKINAEAEKVEIDREGDFVEAENKIYYTVADWCNATSDNLLKELVGEDDG